jgi:hypothetical protein
MLKGVSVTAVLSRTTDPLAPLITTLAALPAKPELPGLTGLVPGLRLRPPLGDGWVEATALLGEAAGGCGDAICYEPIDALLDTAKQRWSASPHVAAALAWKCYSYWTALPAILGYAICRRVPLMTPDAVAVRWSQQQPFLTVGLLDVRVAVLASDPIALDPASSGIVVVPDEDTLRGLLKSSLLEAHLSPLVDRLRTRVHIGRRTLLGSLASGVAHGLSRATDALPGPTLAVAEDLLSLLDVDDLVSLTPAERGGGLSVHRRTCCLAFTLPEPKICAGCCIRSE